MKRFIFIGLLVGLAACSVDRPEGVVERWLNAISQGPTGEPQIYSSNQLADRIVPRPRPASGLEVIEVGRGTSSSSEAKVPYRIMRPRGKEVFGVAELRRNGNSWRIVDLLPKDPELKVPTNGGERIGKAMSIDWLAAAGAGLLLMILVAGIMRLVPPRT